ncbi:MAG TPA: gamma-glutamylcyclotransferase family protein [Tepidisphaeraceae bacterium]|nr:gamma-glutamylcyclotransferase family protein [Tepidisphaeraceae bacterium]
MSDLLFVYGTLLPEAAPEAMRAVIRRCHRGGRGGAATVSGALHDLGSYPGLSIERDGVVRGELVTVNSPSVWLRLDAYEGFNSAHPDRSLFRRQLCVATRIEDGEQLEAWAYVYNRDVRHAPRIDCGCWLTHMGNQGDVTVVAV